MIEGSDDWDVGDVILYSAYLVVMSSNDYIDLSKKKLNL